MVLSESFGLSLRDRGRHPTDPIYRSSVSATRYSTTLAAGLGHPVAPGAFLVSADRDQAGAAGGAVIGRVGPIAAWFVRSGKGRVAVHRACSTSRRRNLVASRIECHADRFRR